MALNAYLKMTGQTSGPVKGSVTQKGREDSIMVVAVNHEIISPRDAASGLPTGKRQHKPVRIMCEVDKATPILYNILVNNENVTEWELQFWRPSRAGTEEQFYTIKLTNANIARIEADTANNKIPELMRLPDMITYDFTYQKIEWTWKDGGITAMDDWEAPV